MKTNFTNFSIYKEDNQFDQLSIHLCDYNDICSDATCKHLFRVSSIQYLALTFDNIDGTFENMRWHLHVNNIVSQLKRLFFKLEI